MNEKRKPKLTALTIEELLMVLNRPGSRMATMETIKEDIANGCPVNEDGTINHVKYTAWQLLQMK